MRYNMDMVPEKEYIFIYVPIWKSGRLIIAYWIHFTLYWYWKK